MIDNVLNLVTSPFFLIAITGWLLFKAAVNNPEKAGGVARGFWNAFKK